MLDKIEASIIVAQNRINELNKIDFTIYHPLSIYYISFEYQISVVKKIIIHCQIYQTKFFYHLIPFDLQQLRFQDEQNL